LRPFQSGFSHSFSPMWKLRTRPCARNTSCHRQPQPSCSHGHPHPIIPRRLLPPLRKMRSLIHPSKDRGRRVVGLALVPTWSISLVVSASDDDDPIRQTAAGRSQHPIRDTQKARGRDVARQQAQTRAAVRESGRGRAMRAMRDCLLSHHSPACAFRLCCSLSSAGRTEGELSEGIHGGTESSRRN